MIYDWGKDDLKRAGVTDWESSARFLLKGAKSEKEFRKYIARRVEREPVDYILGFSEFYGYKFKVNKNVLIPRPETEQLVEIILKDLQGRPLQVLDMGTGSGCIGITLAKKLKNAAVLGADNSKPALAVARENAKKLNAKNYRCIESDLFNKISGRFDLIVANLPYVKTKDKLEPDVAKFEPKRALFAGPGGLDVIKRFIKAAPEHLNPGGSIYMEVGYDQAKEVKKLAVKRSPERKTRISQDYSGKNRYVIIT